MTRKRLKKLMMSMGWDRNSAEECTRMAVARGLNYETVYRFASHGFSACTSLSELLGSAYRTLSKVCGAICTGLNAFAQAVHDAMEDNDADDHG